MLTDKIINNEFDFDEDMINERVVEIEIPVVSTSVRSSRITGIRRNCENQNPNNAQELLVNFEKYLHHEKV